MSAVPWTVVILAGERRGGDPFAQSLGVPHKGLIRVGGRPMLLRVLETFRQLPGVGRIVVVTNTREALLGDRELHTALAAPEVELVEAEGCIADSILCLAGGRRDCWPMLVTTADHALLTPAMAADLMAASRDVDIAIGMVDRRVMLTARPGTRRTWLAFRGGAYTGANLFVLRNAGVLGAIGFWKSMERDRKTGWRLFARCGPWLFLLVMLRRIGLDEALARLGLRFGVRVRAVLLADAEAGIDVDTAGDLALADRILAERGAA